MRSLVISGRRRSSAAHSPSGAAQTAVHDQPVLPSSDDEGSPEPAALTPPCVSRRSHGQSSGESYPPASSVLGRIGRLVVLLIRLVVLGAMLGLIAVAVVILVLPPVSAYVSPQSYVYGDATTAVLIQWSEHDGALDGTFQFASVDASAQVIRVRTAGFSGMHDGERVTITFRDLTMGVPAVSGRLGWRTMQLDLPQPSGPSAGELAAVRLVPGDLNDYDHAVQVLKNAHPGLEIQGD